MKPSQTPDDRPPTIDTNAEKPDHDSFLEHADGAAVIENLTPDTKRSPIIRYHYSTLIWPPV
jgi:hypothetical protein